jgi:hypothetical protein
MGLFQRMAKGIDKQYFIDQLFHTWEPHITKDTDIEKETEDAWDRMRKSPMSGAFKAMCFGKEDVRGVVTEIVNKKKAGR